MFYGHDYVLDVVLNENVYTARKCWCPPNVGNLSPM